MGYTMMDRAVAGRLYRGGTQAVFVALGRYVDDVTADNAYPSIATLMSFTWPKRARRSGGRSGYMEGPRGNPNEVGRRWWARQFPYLPP